MIQETAKQTKCKLLSKHIVVVMVANPTLNYQMEKDKAKKKEKKQQQWDKDKADGKR